MHYERAPASGGSKPDVAPPPFRCAVQGFAPLRRRLGSNCCGHTPRPLERSGRARRRRAKKGSSRNRLVRSTETGARCSLFFKHRRLRRRGFGISPSAVCPIFCKSFHVGASRSGLTSRKLFSVNVLRNHSQRPENCTQECLILRPAQSSHGPSSHSLRQDGVQRDLLDGV
jgi:hypothetical protein